jgi:hypothetical protein
MSLECQKPTSEQTDFARARHQFEAAAEYRE